MGEVQFIKTDGEDLVVLSRRDYDSLLAMAGDPAGEDAMDARILAERAHETALPLAVWDRIEDGEPAVGVIAEYRGMSLEDMVRRTGLTKAETASFMHGEAKPEGAALAKLCAALEVSADVLVG